MTISLFALAAAAAAQAVAPQASIQSAPAATVAPAAPQAVIIQAPTSNVVRAGTEVPLRLEEGLDSNDKALRVGQQFRMSVASDVRLGNLVVIPAGSLATGEITDLRRKGMWGKSGRINARVLSVRVGDRLIRLTGNFDDKGVTGTAGVVAAIAFVPIAGFFMTGTSAKIPAGGGVKGFLDEDIQIAVPQAAAPVQSQPVQVLSVQPGPAAQGQAKQH
ncbi:hypothetical protein LZ519_00030 [Sphingomonas sp. RG327]|jgi:hypothetical protein|uniref:TrbI/VirB10 family protein n=1 Tax=Sphingomonas anseongensis TaxID=2908207 RepID=A0ABT0RBT0_9SPHN|nr:hypothetical protein [Sphingomonas anseongensis]MCL6677712.1 hypothetical protein [Sphingomonas anseongensis]